MARKPLCCLSLLIVAACAGCADDAGAEHAASAKSAALKCGATPKKVLPAEDLTAFDEGVQYPGLSAAVDLAAGDDDLYVAAAYDRQGAIMRVPKSGGKAQLVARTQGTEQGMLVLDDAVVFVQSHQNDSSASGDVVRVGLHGGETKVLASGPIDEGSIFGPNGVIASDGHDVFFATRAGVMSVPLKGGDAKLLTEHTGAVAVVDSQLVIADSNAHGVFITHLEGGEEGKLAADQFQSMGPIVSCGENICWASASGDLTGTGAITQLDHQGKLKLVGAGGELFVIYRLVSDGDGFFASTLGDISSGWLFRVEHDGSFIRMGEGSGIAIDDDCLYMASIDGVTSVAKSYRGPDAQ